jgi:mannose-1-phosphate guanylyltransferase
MLTATRTPGALTATVPPHRTNVVDAIVLAGTHSWRHTAFDSLLPRPLLPIAHLPLISHTLRWAASSGVRHITVCANGLTSLIRQHLREHVAVLPPIDYYDDTSPRGAAGAARDAALATDADFFVVADATTIPNVQLARALEAHRQSGAALAVIVQPSAGETARGPRPLIPTGLYIFSRRAFDAVPAYGYQDIKEELIPRLYAAGELVTTIDADGTCPRVLDGPSYLSVNHWMIARLAAQRAPSRGSGGGQAIVHPSARVSPSALLVGPVLVDEGAEIEPGATVVGPTAIGARSVVGAGAVLSRSVVWARCSIEPGAVLDRTVLGNDVAVKAGSRLANTVRTAIPPRAHIFDAHDAVAPPLPEVQAGLSIGHVAVQ